MNLTNYHSHCIFCDGKADMETFVRFAVSQGFSSYGFSSHAPLPFETSWTLLHEDVGNYLNEFHRLKQAYSDRIELYVGLEIDYLNEKSNPNIAYFQELPLDYRIGSVHLLPDLNGKIVDIDVAPEKFRALVNKHFYGDLDYVICLYYSQLKKMVQRGGFDIVGHADKLHYNATCIRPDLLNEMWYNRIVTDYFEEIVKRNYMVELNTKSFLKSGVFFPNQRYLPFFREMGVKMVVNSDAHYPDQINNGRAAGLRALKNAGFETVSELHQGVWKQVEIEI